MNHAFRFTSLSKQLICRGLNQSIFKSNPKISNEITDQILIFRIEFLQFKSNPRMYSNRDLNSNRDLDLPVPVKRCYETIRYEMLF